MDMCYDGTLVMPSSYAVMDEDEMSYVEGGKPRSTNWISIPIDLICTVIGLNCSAIIGCAGAAIAKYAAKKIAVVARHKILQNLIGGCAVSFLTGTVSKMSKNNTVLRILMSCTSFGGIIGLMCDMNDGMINSKFNAPC